MSHWSPLAPRRNTKWTEPAQTKNDDEGIGGEEPQALAAEPQAEAKSQEALEHMVLLPIGEAEPPRGPYYIHEGRA